VVANNTTLYCSQNGSCYAMGENVAHVILQKKIVDLLKTEVCPQFGSSEEQVSYT